jgi:hypothetical protein
MADDVLESSRYWTQAALHLSFSISLSVALCLRRKREFVRTGIATISGYYG